MYTVRTGALALVQEMATSSAPKLIQSDELLHPAINVDDDAPSSSDEVAANAAAASTTVDTPAAEPEPEPPQKTTGLRAELRKATGETLNSSSSEDNHPQKPELVREVTRYTTRNGLDIAVEGFRWVSDERGGNLAAHGKHTGEAFWHVSWILSDYLCWDCPALQPELVTGKRRRVIDLGCGLGLAGLVAATLLDETGRVDLTDGDGDVVHRAKLSARANETATRPATVAASVLRWGDENAIAALNQTAKANSEAACFASSGSDGERNPESVHDGSVGGYDLVLASDCIYENGSDPSIAVAMATVLAKTAAVLLKPEPMDYALLPVRGETPPEEWHAWIDMAERVGEADADEYVWPPQPCRQGQARYAECQGGALENEGDMPVHRTAVHVRPMCVVGFCRRNVPLSVILDAFEAEGFEHHVPHAGHQDDPDAPEGCAGCGSLSRKPCVLSHTILTPSLLSCVWLATCHMSHASNYVQ